MRRIDLARGSPSPRKYTSYVLAIAVAATAFLAAMVLIPILRPAPRIAPPAQPSERAGEAPAVLVHVAGAVRKPGLYELNEGDRVADAIEAAGGSRRGADLDVLNLAQVVVDGSRIEVPVKGVAPGIQPTTPAGTAPMVSLNSATQAELETIPGVGPVTAQAILTHRLEIGGFTALEQLLDVDGIGPATFESLSAYVTL